MALDATVAGKNANSYVTRAVADTFFTAGMHPKSGTWSTLTANQKDEYLIAATEHIDMQRLQGVKNDPAIDTDGLPKQRLHFPRPQDDESGTKYIPLAVKEATYMQAIFLATRGSGHDTRENLQSDGVSSVSIGDVSESYDLAGSKSPRSLLSKESRGKLWRDGLLIDSGRVKV